MASTILVDKIDPQSGTALEIGTSGDTITVPSGATFNVAGTLQSGGAAVGNTPMFHAYMSGNQSISNSSNTKIAFDSERIDTDSAFDTSNNRFTVPSGAAGKYLFTYWGKMGLDDGKILQLIMYKNGSELSAEETRANFYSSGSGQQINAIGSFMDTAAVSDYYEVYVFQNNGGSVNLLQETAGFMGFKLIG
jgi:hypothetical protein